MFKFLVITVLFVSSHLYGAGEVKDGKVSAYLVGALEKIEDVKKSLGNAGFEVISESVVDKKGKLTTIIFTSDMLKSIANKKGRGFASVLRVLVDEIDGKIRITNPIYFQKAFLQKEYDKTVAKKLLVNINKNFPGLTDSKDKLVFDELGKFHFMAGMPYYDEMKMVGTASGDVLLKNLKEYKDGKKVLFEVKLDKNRVLVGYQLSNRTSKFIKKIGTKNALVLPYTILIEDGVAKILAPKYYLALAYPSLTMAEFMTIATIPGAIQKECSKPFK